MGFECPLLPFWTLHHCSKSTTRRFLLWTWCQYWIFAVKYPQQPWLLTCITNQSDEDYPAGPAVASTHSEVCFSLLPMLLPDRQAQPAARRTLSSLSGQREDESISQDDPIPGVLGSCQTFRQSPPSRQHDHRQRQNQHQSECCSFSDANTKVQIRLTHGPILLSGRSDGPVPLPDETRKVSKRHIYDTWSLRPQDSLFKQLHRTTFILLMYQFFLSLTLNPGPNPRGGGLKKNSMNGWFAPLTALTHKSK